MPTIPLRPPTISPDRSRRPRRRPAAGLGRLGAAALLLAVVVVPPSLLLLLTGNPIDPPAALRSTNALRHQLDDATVVYLLAAVGWLCWLHLLGCLLTETLQQARGSRVRMPSPRLLGANSLLASHLITALLMSSSAVGLTPALAGDVAVVATHSSGPGSPATAPTPATHGLGPDAAQPSPFERHGARDRVTTRSDAPPVLRCRVLPPEGRHHDTLWDIAERHLGDGQRWREVYELNEGRVMPDGERLTRASLIRPGWILHLPADATALPQDAVPTPPEPHARAEAGHHQAGPAAAPGAADTAPKVAPHPAPDRSPAAAVQTSPARPGPVPTRLRAHRPAQPPAPGLAAAGTPTHGPVDASPDSAEGRSPCSGDRTAPAPIDHRPEQVGRTVAGPPPTAANARSPEQRPAPNASPATHPATNLATNPAGPAASPGGSTTSSQQTPATQTPPTGQPPAHDPDDTDEVAAGAGVLGLAAVGLLMALTRRRKVAARRRPVGTRPATPHPDLLAVEARLRQDARSAQDIAAAVRLAVLLASRHHHRLDLVAVWHHPDDSLELVTSPEAEPGNSPELGGTASAAVPTPFHASPRGWVLPAEARPFLFATTRTSTLRSRLEQELEEHDDPFPLLLPVGAQDSSACLVNLRHFGLISVTEDAPGRSHGEAAPAPAGLPDRVARACAPDVDAADPPAHAPTPGLRGEGASGDGSASDRSARATGVPAVLAGWIQQLAGAPWSADLRILLAPSYAELATGLDRVSPLAPEDLTRLSDHAGRGAGSGAPDDGATDGPAAELLVGFRPDQLPAALLSDAATGHGSVTVMVHGMAAEASSWLVRSDGTLAIPGVADQLTPVCVDGATLQRVLRLLEHAQDPPRATATDPGRRARALDAPPTPVHSPTTEDAATTGTGPAQPPSLHMPPTSTSTSAPTPTSTPTPAASEVRAKEVDAAGGLPTDPGAGTVDRAPGGAVDTTPDTEDNEDNEDSADSADSAGPSLAAAPGSVRVDVLGPVTVTGTSATLGATLRQVLLYLALHRRPVATRALWEAVWPDREFNDHSLRSRCNELKRYLHGQLVKEGRAWLLPEAVRCDWQEFQALAAGDLDSRRAALALVRGRPFEDCAPDWIHLEGFAAEVEASIVDLALEVARDALERGDTTTASFAAAAGCKASPYEERLVQLGIRAAQERGAYSLARSLHRQLAVVLDEEIEPDDTEQPETTRLVSDLTYAEGLRRYQARRSDSGI